MRGQHDRGCQKGKSVKGAGILTIHSKRYALLVSAGQRITMFSTIPVTLFDRVYLCKTLSPFKGSEPTRLLKSRFDELIPQRTGCAILHVEV
jgi:hypothetical protein